jgi:dienelactone hydrolase
MAEIVLFHHTQGLTPGVVDLADRLRAGGHTVHTPDLFEGRTFATVEEGIAYTRSPEAPDVDALVDAAVAGRPAGLVYAGISFGVVSAQRLAQTRPGAAGAVLLESCLPTSGEWSFGPWPDEVPVQIHGKDADPFFAGEGDVDNARQIAATARDAELFTYPGDQHLFVDSSLPSYDAAATDLVVQRVLGFLSRSAGRPTR